MFKFQHLVLISIMKSDIVATVAEIAVMIRLRSCASSYTNWLHYTSHIFIPYPPNHYSLMYSTKSRTCFFCSTHNRIQISINCGNVVPTKFLTHFREIIKCQNRHSMAIELSEMKHQLNWIFKGLSDSH